MSTPTEQQIKDLCALYGVYPERLVPLEKKNYNAGWVVKRFSPHADNGSARSRLVTVATCFYMSDPSSMLDWVETVVYYSKLWESPRV